MRKSLGKGVESDGHADGEGDDDEEAQMAGRRRPPATMMSILVFAAGNVSLENHFLVREEATALSS